MTDADIEVEQDAVIETEVTDVFGAKISRALVAIDWKLKENALKSGFRFCIERSIEI